MKINFVRSCECRLHQESQCGGKPVDRRKGAQHAKGRTNMGPIIDNTAG